MDEISTYFRKLLDRLLTSEQLKFSRITIKKEVVEDIIGFARGAYPKEFVAALEGSTRNGTLTITGLLYQPFRASETSALPEAMIPMPMTSGSVGSVHSHPSGSNSPSRQDLHFFTKKGIIHLIIRKPFRPEDIACYNLKGEPCKFEIVD
jgi:proteasome lid subunit RPN8/RPN11